MNTNDIQFYKNELQQIHFKNILVEISVATHRYILHIIDTINSDTKQLNYTQIKERNI